MAKLLLHDTKNMTAIPGLTFGLSGSGWQTEHFGVVGTRRGVGSNRLWLPWVSTSHLNGILFMEQFDPDLFSEFVPAVIASAGEPKLCGQYSRFRLVGKMNPKQLLLYGICETRVATGVQPSRQEMRVFLIGLPKKFSEDRIRPGKPRARELLRIILVKCLVNKASAGMGPLQCVETSPDFAVIRRIGDPLGPYRYKARLSNPTNDHYAIDGTVFSTTNGALYFVWAARPNHVLYMARMEDPWTLGGNGVYIPASGFGCEEVREAPAILQRNGKVFLVYSACDTGKPDYKLGMLIADETADLLNPDSWKQFPRPVFERCDFNGVFGPGHNGFFKSPDGTEDWIIYHAKTTSKYTYAGRTTRAQTFTWNADGTPNFGVPLSLESLLDEPSHQ